KSAVASSGRDDRLRGHPSDGSGSCLPSLFPSGPTHSLRPSVSQLHDPSADEIILGDCLEVLPRFADGSFQLIYIDPPFNTGRAPTSRATGPALKGAATPRACSPRALIATRSTITWRSLRRAWSTRGACSRARAPSTFTSTTARPTTASCSWTRYSVGSASSTS